MNSDLSQVNSDLSQVNSDLSQLSVQESILSEGSYSSCLMVAIVAIL